KPPKVVEKAAVLEPKKGLPPADDGKAAAEALARKLAAQTEQRARLLVEKEHDYRTAALLLEDVPAHLRNDAFYKEVLALRDRTAQLDQDIKAALKAKRWVEVQNKVAALAKLQPQRLADLQLVLNHVQREIEREQDLAKKKAAALAKAESPKHLENSIGLKL